MENSKSLPFTKANGLGNDFIIIDDLKGDSHPGIEITPDLIKTICTRRFGIGADQVLWIKPPESEVPSEAQAEAQADARMEIFNSDGSNAEMCGNGIRAVALYLNRNHSPSQFVYGVETQKRIQRVRILDKVQAEVDMGPPELKAGFESGFSGERLEVYGEVFSFYEVSMGNPHAVIFVEDLSTVNVEKIGPAIESNPRFPNRTNVEFVQILNPHSIRLLVWERGTGATWACGSGACAAAVAALATGKVKNPVDVILLGGVLKIQWDPSRSKGSVIMTGPAVEVFHGEYFID